MEELVERTKNLSNHIDVLINPDYLVNEYSEKTAEEVKAIMPDKTQQLPYAAQQELSMRGNRTAFLEFHRFMYSLTDDDMKQLKMALRKYYNKNKLSESDSIYNDVSILEDVIDFQVCLRDNNIPFCAEIAKSYRQNQKLAEDFPEVTSDHLIDFAKKLLNQTTRKFQGISVYLPPEDHKKLRILAAENDTTITALAKEAIRDLFTKYEKGEGK